MSQTYLFSLPSKVFGFVCLVHNNDPHKTDSDPLALKCVFFGYSHTQKRHEYYFPKLKCFIIFAYVTFCEFKSYFETESHSSKSAKGYMYFFRIGTFNL